MWPQNQTWRPHKSKRQSTTLPKQLVNKISRYKKNNFPFSSSLYFIKNDVVAVLPPFADFIEPDESTERGKSIVIVISPLNVLIKDQVAN